MTLSVLRGLDNELEILHDEMGVGGDVVGVFIKGGVRFLFVLLAC